MNRKDFFKEIGSSLLETVKSAAEPFIQEDLEKIETAADRALGVEWMPLMQEEELRSNLEIRYIAGRPIIVSKFRSNIQAWDGICLGCSNIITISTLYSSGKCLNCDKEFNFQTLEGTLKLDPLAVKKKDHMYFVGYRTVKK